MTKKDKHEIATLINQNFDTRFEHFDSKLDQKWGRHLDERFNQFEIRLEKKLDERFEHFAILMNRGFEIQAKWLDERMDIKMDYRFGQFREYLDEKFQVVAEGYRMTNERLDRVDNRLGNLETRFDRLEGNLLLSGVIA